MEWIEIKAKIGGTVSLSLTIANTKNISLVLPADDVILTPDQARSLATHLLTLANKAEE